MFRRAAIIIVLGAIAYGSMLPAPFRVMDDRISIVDNPIIKSTANILLIFKEGYFHDQSYYRPLVNLSYMAEYQAFKLNSFYYNLDNLILHIINAFLVVLLVTRLTSNSITGFWTGILFVLHPVQWEAVCNIPGRAILLSAFFVLCSFNILLGVYNSRRWEYLALVLVTFFMGLLCKESTGVLPVVVLAYFLQDNTRCWPEKLKCLWPFIIGIAIYVFLRKYLGITKVSPIGQISLLVMSFVTFLRSVITDLRLFILPLDLHFDRCLPLFFSLGQPQAIATCSFWALALTGLTVLYRKIPVFILFLMAWFFIELLPVSQLVTSIGVGVGRISTAEHFLYIACIPVFAGMVMAFQWLYEANVKKNHVKPVYLKLLAGGYLVFLLLIAVEQSIYASNEFTMVKRSLAIEPDNPRLEGSMAMLSVFRNDTADAEKHFLAAIKAEPFNPTYHIGLGTALSRKGDWIGGLEQFVAFPTPEKDRVMVERQEQLNIVKIRQLIEKGKTFDARGWLAIGIYYAKIGNQAQAIAAFKESVTLNPHQVDAWFNLGSLFEADNDRPEALAAYKQLLDLGEGSDFQKDFARQHLKDLGGRS